MDKVIKINGNRVFIFICYAIMLLFALICLLPIINVLALSFSPAYETVTFFPTKFTLYSYQTVLNEKGFYLSFMWSVIVTIGGTALSVFVMLLAAYVLSKPDVPFRKSIMIFFIITMLFSGGIIPSFLWFKIIGIIDTPFAIILPMVIQVYNLILIKTFLEGLPQSIEDAARIDGAGNLAVMLKIIIPMSIPIIITVSLFTVVGIWNNYQLALFFIPTKTQYYPLSMYILNFINGSAANDLYGDPVKAAHKNNIEAAMIFLSVLPIVASYPFFLKYFTQGVAVGSVKE